MTKNVPLPKTAVEILYINIFSTLNKSIFKTTSAWNIHNINYILGIFKSLEAIMFTWIHCLLMIQRVVQRVGPEMGSLDGSVIGRSINLDALLFLLLFGSF